MNLLRPYCTALLLSVFVAGTNDAETCDIEKPTDQFSALQAYLDIDSKSPHSVKQPKQVETNSSFPRLALLLQAAGQVAERATVSAVAHASSLADLAVGDEEKDFVFDVKNKQTPHLGPAIAVGVIVACIVAYWISRSGSRPGGEKEDDDDEEVEQRTYEALDEDTYRLAIVLLVRDGQFLAKGAGASMLRATRIFGHVGLLLVTIVIQIVLLNQIKWLVTPQAVTTIREAYDKYELHMCGGIENQTTLTVNGKHRCKPQFFQPDLFMGLDDDLKVDVCNIPFSQLRFFKLVLLIWSLTCIGQIKMCIETFVTLMVVTPTCESMVTAVQPLNQVEHRLTRHDTSGSIDGTGSEAEKEEGGPERVIIALTRSMKAIIFLTVLLPWFLITCNLLAQGSRWLTATNDFGELILNAVGLEFVLLLKDLVYHTIVAERNKRELRNTLVHPIVKKEPAGYLVFMGGFIWGAMAVLWVFVYIFHLQTVLPEYKWDVHASCTKWLKSLTVKPNLTALRAAGIGTGGH